MTRMLPQLSQNCCFAVMALCTCLCVHRRPDSELACKPASSSDDDSELDSEEEAAASRGSHLRQNPSANGHAPGQNGTAQARQWFQGRGRHASPVCWLILGSIALPHLVPCAVQMLCVCAWE